MDSEGWVVVDVRNLSLVSMLLLMVNGSAPLTVLVDTEALSPARP